MDHQVMAVIVKQIELSGYELILLTYKNSNNVISHSDAEKLQALSFAKTPSGKIIAEKFKITAASLAHVRYETVKFRKCLKIIQLQCITVIKLFIIFLII